MARQKDEVRRQAIVDAAAKLIARDGLGAATAAIAKLAGISSGSLFTYFPNKNDLLNQLYLEIKLEIVTAIDEDFPEATSEREQLLHMWSRWTAWGANNPEKRSVLAQLRASDVISEDTKIASYRAASRSVELVYRVASRGSLKNQMLEFSGAIVEGLADITMDFMIRNPSQADSISLSAFDVLWKALT